MMFLALVVSTYSPQVPTPQLPDEPRSAWLGYELSQGRYDSAERFYQKFKRVRYPIIKGDQTPDAMAYVIAIARYPANIPGAKRGVDWLLKRGASPNGYKGAPFANAVFDKTGEMLRYLLKKGANPHLFDPKKDAPLFSAIDNRLTNNIEILLSKRVDVNKQVSKKGQTPLMWAAQHGDDKLAVRLLAAGAKLNIQQPRSGYTALHWAVTNDQASMVALLLRRGAKKNLQELNGRTPLEMARKLGATKSIAKLEAK